MRQVSEILYLLYYFLVLMDNIGIEAYVVCCLLPLLAFLALAAEIYRSSFPKSSPPTHNRARSDHFLQSMQGLITIVQQKKRQLTIEDYQSQPKRDLAAASRVKESGQNMLGYQSLRKGVSSTRRSLLTGCSAGLARMKQINQAYLNSRKGYYASCLKQAHSKRFKRMGKEDFKPTFLPIIVEGLQY